MIRAYRWVMDHPKTVAAIGVGVLLLTLVAGVVGFRRPKPTTVEQTSATTATAQATTTTSTNTTTVEREREVTTRPDGTRSVRTRVRDSRSDTERRREEAARVETRVETRIVTEPAKPAFLGLMAAAEWDALQLSPTGYRVAADASVGKLLGIQLRAGVEVHLPSNRAVPDGAGVYLRAEIP